MQDLSYGPPHVRFDLDSAARQALEKVLREAAKNKPDASEAALVAGIASAMGYGSSMIHKLRAGAPWPGKAIAALAAATGQKPGLMLAEHEGLGLLIRALAPIAGSIAAVGPSDDEERDLLAAFDALGSDG